FSGRIPVAPDQRTGKQGLVLSIPSLETSDISMIVVGVPALGQGAPFGRFQGCESSVGIHIH
ncbi:MAG: hypothetical protein WD005_06035, partial [Haliea sp.]